MHHLLSTIHRTTCGNSFVSEVVPGLTTQSDKLERIIGPWYQQYMGLHVVTSWQSFSTEFSSRVCPGHGHFRVVTCDPRVKLVSLLWNIVFQTKDLEPSAGRGK